MAFIIQSSISPTSGFVAPTGRPSQGHLCYAVNQGAYWTFYLSSTQTLNALYSTNNGVTWNTPAGSPYTLQNPHNGEGRNFGFCYVNISNNDILYMNSSYNISASTFQYFARFILGTSWSDVGNKENSGGGSNEIGGGTPATYVTSGVVLCLDSTNRPYAISSFVGGNNYPYVAVAGNVDNGFSWSNFGTSTNGNNDYVYFPPTNQTTSIFICPTAPATVIGIVDDGSGIGTFANLRSSLGTSAHGSPWETGTVVLGSNVTQTDNSGWGAIARATNDIHVVALSNNSNTYVHRRWNGASWVNGDIIGSLSYGTTSSISLVSDGTSVWAAIIDSSNNIQVNWWQSIIGWSGWTVQEASRTNTPSYITGCYDPIDKQIMWTWGEINGSNYDLIGTTYNIVYPPIYTVSLPSPDSLSYPCKQVASGWV
jgi:hypothetical protein